MLHLTRRKTHLDRYENTNWYYKHDSFVWGRACKVTDTLYHIMQEPVRCKDYIVDTYYRSPLSPLFTEEEQLQGCYYIQIPTKLQENFIHNMATFFWPYEDKHGFDRTVLQQVSRRMKGTTAKPFIIEVDKKWLTNTAILSMYLSLIRLCVYSINMSESSLINTQNLYLCNEHAYIQRLSKITRPIWDFYVNNPTKMLIESPTPSGYPKNDAIGHGMTGLFNLLFTIDAMRTIKLDVFCRISTRSHIFKELLTIYLQELKTKNVQPLPQL